MTTEEMQKQIESMMPTPKQIVESIDKNLRDYISRKTRKQKTMADIFSKVTKEKCNGCKWLFDAPKISCLNSRLCINYNEWEEKL